MIADMFGAAPGDEPGPWRRVGSDQRETASRLSTIDQRRKTERPRYPSSAEKVAILLKLTIEELTPIQAGRVQDRYALMLAQLEETADPGQT